MFSPLQVPFAIVSPNDAERNMGPAIPLDQRTEQDTAYTYLIGRSPGPGGTVSVVIGYNGVNHFAPTVTTGGLFFVIV